jgi:hypothetical protein
MEPTNDHERLIAQAVDEKFLEDPGNQSTARDIATSVNFIIMSPSDSQFLVRYVQWRRDHPIRLWEVSDYPPRDFGDAHWERSQGALIDFIHADLDLAFTWLRTADIDVRDDPKGRELVLAKVGATLDAIRRLEGRLNSDLPRREIDARVDELEKAIAAFRP